jgi:hypothetical protein
VSEGHIKQTGPATHCCQFATQLDAEGSTRHEAELAMCQPPERKRAAGKKKHIGFCVAAKQNLEVCRLGTPSCRVKNK